MKKTPAKSRTKKNENALHKIPLRITDTTLRDAHQSLWATRMRTDDILKIVDAIDNVGYYSLECWGGATFDVCLRFLRENPWERLRLIRQHAPKTPLQMLLRGQNLVGYRNYADDVVDRFVALACENGIDIFRVFDALNDTRNLEAAIRAVKRHGGHAQGTLCYTTSPVHTVEKYVQYAKDQVAIGIDSLCIKDMAGILSPVAAEALVSALVEEVGIPIQLHCHATSGMATATYVEAVRAGAGAIDCAISTMAGFSAQPPVETLAAIFNDTPYAAKLNPDALEKVAAYFSELAPTRSGHGGKLGAIIDPGILIHQIPGGMISNFRSQLEKQKALDKLPEVLAEVTQVRKDLGYPPLVTPTSQIVGTQAVMNVLSGGRYKIVPNEVKDYVRGLYGRSPAPIAKSFIKKILGNETPITHRPADKLPPMLPTATDGAEPALIQNEEDILSYCILPEPAVEYFKWRAMPEDERPPIPADLELEEKKDTAPTKAAAKAAPAKPAAPKVTAAAAGPLKQMVHPEDYRGVALLLEKGSSIGIDEMIVQKGDFQVAVRSAGATPSAFPPLPVAAAPAVATTPPAAAAAPAETQAPVEPETTPAVEEPEAIADETVEPDAEDVTYEKTINAPLGGIFYSAPGPGKDAFCAVGDTVKANECVCIVEAMKLFNHIEAPEDCRILAFLVKDGDEVERDQPLIAFESV